MRVTDGRMYGMAQTSLASARSRLSQLHQQALEGKRVIKPSDDPAASARSRQLSSEQTRAEGHLRTAEAAHTGLMSADNALSDVGNILTRVKELALQQSTDTTNPDARAAAAAEVASLRETVLALANTEVGGRYVFSGFRDDQPAFDAAATYQGTPEVRQVEIAPALQVEAGIAGDKVFGAAGGVDVFAALDSLQSALSGNDSTAIRATLESLDRAHTQIITARAQLGARLSSVEAAEAIARRVHDGAIENRSRIMDADMPATLLDLVEAERVLQTATELAGRLPVGGLTSGR